MEKKKYQNLFHLKRKSGKKNCLVIIIKLFIYFLPQSEVKKKEKEGELLWKDVPKQQRYAV